MAKWPLQKVKWRAALRAEYLKDTGKTEIVPNEFEAWLVARGILPPQS